MGWDASRPVPWQQLMRSWLVYVAIMAVVFVAFFRDDNLIGILAGLLVSGPLYLAIGYVLAKFGYRRKTLKELRAEREQQSAASAAAAPTSAPSRPKPAPTKRTGGGGQRSSQRKRRR